MTVIGAWIEDHQWFSLHERVEVAQQGMGTEQWPGIPHSGHKNQIMICRLGCLDKLFGDFPLMQWPFKGFEHCLIPLFLLQRKGFIKKTTFLEIIHQELEKVHMGDTQFGYAFGCLIHDELDVLAHFKLSVGRIVKDVNDG